MTEVWLNPALSRNHIDYQLRNERLCAFWAFLCISIKMLELQKCKALQEVQYQILSLCCTICSNSSCMVGTEMSGLTCGMLGVFHKVKLAQKNRLHTRPHPIIHLRPSLLSSYKRLSHWCYPQQQLCEDFFSCHFWDLTFDHSTHCGGELSTHKMICQQ